MSITFDEQPEWMTALLADGKYDEISAIWVSTLGYVKQAKNEHNGLEEISHGEDFILGFEMFGRDEDGNTTNGVGGQWVAYALPVDGAVALCRLLLQRLPSVMVLAIASDALRTAMAPVKMEMPGLPEPRVPASPEGVEFAEQRSKRAGGGS